MTTNSDVLSLFLVSFCATAVALGASLAVFSITLVAFRISRSLLRALTARPSVDCDADVWMDCLSEVPATVHVPRILPRGKIDRPKEPPRDTVADEEIRPQPSPAAVESANTEKADKRCAEAYFSAVNLYEELRTPLFLRMSDKAVELCAGARAGTENAGACH